MNIKNLITLSLMLSVMTLTSIKSECTECTKLRDELSKAWQSSLKFSSEIRSLTDSILKHSETIRKYNGTA